MFPMCSHMHLKDFFNSLKEQTHLHSFKTIHTDELEWKTNELYGVLCIEL